MDDERYFVGVNNHLEVRRNILESSRDMIQTMQSYEKVKAIREAKLKRLRQLRTVVKELDLLMARLQEQLPKTNLRAAMVEPAPSAMKVHAKNKKDKREVNEIERLESQLKEIEQELSRIN
jgi:hypothetical protein